MKIFNFHPETKEYLGEGDADRSPLDEEEVWLIPANATTVKPGGVPDGYVAVFDSGAWSSVEDHRGETWWSEEGNPVVIDFLGDPAERYLSSEEPILPVMVPDQISPAQLFSGLAFAGFITPQEAIDAATVGTVPASIDALFGQLSPQEQMVARIRWARMTTVERNNPLLLSIAAANNLSSEEIDDAFWQWSMI